MKILFDHCVPRPLRRFFTSHSVETTAQNGWQELSNGKLLDAAEGAGFEVFFTVDANLSYQQNFSERSIRVVALENVPNNRTLTLAPHIPQVLEILPSLAPGELRRVRAEWEPERKPKERDWGFDMER